MQVYLSGGIAGVTDPEGRFKHYQDAVESWGAAPVNPLRLHPNHQLTECPPSVIKGADGHGWSCHLRVDLAAMLECDAVVMLPGWETSHGARLEHQVAASCGIRIFYFRGGVSIAYDSMGYPLHQVVEDHLGIRAL